MPINNRREDDELVRKSSVIVRLQEYEARIRQGDILAALYFSGRGKGVAEADATEHGSWERYAWVSRSHAYYAARRDALAAKWSVRVKPTHAPSDDLYIGAPAQDNRWLWCKWCLLALYEPCPHSIGDHYIAVEEYTQERSAKGMPLPHDLRIPVFPQK